MSDVFLSIVIPAFDEEARIGASLERVRDYLTGQDYASEVVVVDDGSSDATAAIVRRADWDRPRVRLISTEHRGKGHAVKTGMLQAEGEFRFLCDADLAMPIEQVSRFIPPRLEGVDVAVGSREAPGSRRFEEPAYRHVMGRVYNAIVRTMAVPGISDTQAGFKCFRSSVARGLFEQQRLDGFGFDVEILSWPIAAGCASRRSPSIGIIRERARSGRRATRSPCSGRCSRSAGTSSAGVTVTWPPRNAGTEAPGGRTMRGPEQILAETRTIAVVGLSDRPDRTSNRIAKYLQEQGYRIVPVNPTIDEVLGEKSYPDLASVPEPVDMVQVFRRSEEVMPIAEQAVAMETAALWMQDGIVNEEAAELARANGLDVVMDDCVYRWHRRLKREGKL